MDITHMHGYFTYNKHMDSTDMHGYYTYVGILHICTQILDICTVTTHAV